MAELKNIVFDMGNVLIQYDPESFLTRRGIADPAAREILLRTIFRSPEWSKLDSGEWDEADLEAHILPRLPAELHGAARGLIWRWDDPIVPIVGVAELMARCKARGMKLFLLSNASRRQHEYWHRVPGWELMDGAMISADVRMTKPDAGIFLRLLEEYGLCAEETLFVDDVEANCRGAEAVGMRAFWFRGDADALEKYISG